MRHFVNFLCLLSLGLNMLSHAAMADLASEQTAPEVNVFPTSDGEEIVSRMTGTEVSFHAMLQGPTVDTELSGILANLTGGTTELATSVNHVIFTAKQSALRGDQSIALNLARRAGKPAGGNHRLTALIDQLEKTPAPPEPVASIATGNDVSGPPDANAGELLNQSEMKILIRTQRLVQQVNAAIKEAKKIAGEKPDYSLSRLKDILETILSTPELAPEKRTELERRVIDAIGFVQSHREKEAILQREQSESRATLAAGRRTLTEMQLEDERLQSMISQVRGLLDRATHGDNEAFEDAERVARTAFDTKPGDGIATAAMVMSETTGQLNKAYRLKNLRQDRFLEVLYQVELSHVPFPDEPPVIYPPADVWRALSLTRRKKYESISLRNEKPAEKWLQRMLDEPVKDLSFPGENPLTDILEQIRTHFTTTYGNSGSAGADYRMTILPDVGALNDDSVQLQDVIIKDIELDGITLRNALAIILSQTDPELTYMIRNEVMFITTRAFAEADEQLQTRVYQVGDLVIPPVQLGGSGISGGGQGGFGAGSAGGFGGAGFGLSPETLFHPAAKSNRGISNDTLNSSATNQHDHF